MSNEVGLFAGNPLANSELFKSLQDLNKNLTGGSFGTTRRISLKNSKFRQIVNGEQLKVSRDDTMNIVIIDAAPVSRTFYEGNYDPDKSVPPTCWSNDTNEPAEDVEGEHKQATRCADCPQNIKGSGQGTTRACRYNQRMAIAIEGDLKTVYQLQLAATSIFGDSKENEMPMQAYARFLQAHNTPAIAVVTEMRFDLEADVPKLFFKPVRPLEEDELNQVVSLRDTEEVKNAITFKVFDTDQGKTIASDDEPTDKGAEEVDEAVKAAKVAATKAAAAKKAKAAKIAAAKKALEEAEGDDEPAVEEKVEEPVKVEKPSAAEADKESDLASIVADWDDDE